MRMMIEVVFLFSCPEVGFLVHWMMSYLKVRWRILNILNGELFLLIGLCC